MTDFFAELDLDHDERDVGVGPDDVETLRTLIDKDVDRGAYAFEASTNGTLPGRTEIKLGGFHERVGSRRVDLIQRIRDGLPPITYIPGSSDILTAGRRHHMPAVQKMGKSFAALVHTVDMALAGARVVIFDRENGAYLYAVRLSEIVAARALDEAQQATVAANLAYYEFPKLQRNDQDDLVELCAGADLVVFDSQRLFLSDLGLVENSSDDYADFMDAAVDPLFRAGIATLVLDNAGHRETKRGRGTSSKGDLNEILFTLETIEKFNQHKTGRLRLEIDNSRLGNSGRWEMQIGGSVFGSWTPVEDTHDADPASFRPTHLMERASRAHQIAGLPLSRTALATMFPGKVQWKFRAIDQLVTEGYEHQDGEKLAFARLFTDDTTSPPEKTALPSLPATSQATSHGTSPTTTSPLPSASLEAEREVGSEKREVGSEEKQDQDEDTHPSLPDPPIDADEIERLAALAREATK